MADAVNDSIRVITGVTEAVNPVVSAVIIAVLILLLGLVIGKLVGNLIRRLLNEIQVDKSLRAVLGSRFSLEKAIGNLASYIIYLITIVMSLNKLGLTTAILSIIAAVIVLVLVISFLLSIRDLFPNIFAGIRLKTKKIFKEGDEIQIREVRGKIDYIGFMETKLTTRYGEEIIIPNSVFSKRQIIVRKKSDEKKSSEKNKN